jgi:NAD+ synthase (glutamine-hydrolysing)
VGLSGGIDSAVVVALLYKAVGPKRLIVFNLPSQYNSEKTKGLASLISRKLQLPLHVIPIQEISELNRALLSQFNPTDFNYENIQAKIRGTSVLSNVAGILNGFMTCNGNKVEIALGYATLYGDVNGVVAPIGDLLKTEVFEMARFLNNEIFKDEIIPADLIPDDKYNFGMPPSAELKHAQIDPMKWGYHDALIEAFTDYRKVSPETILLWYSEKCLCEKLGIAQSLFEQYQLDNAIVFIEDLEWVVKSMQRMVFKRVQAPPIIILSKGSYGYDIRESQLPYFLSDEYVRLREEILSRAMVF